MDQFEIKAPTLPESVSEAKIITWYKKKGDSVVVDEKLVDLETDKIVLEVSASASGVLEKILKEAGSLVKSQEVLALLAVEMIKEKNNQNNSNIKQESISVSSPAVRRLASEKSVDLKTIQGTGKKGRLTTDDVLKASDEKILPAEKRVPMSLLRSRIAERLMRAQQEAVILTTFNEINMQPVMDLRRKYNEIFQKDHGVRLGFTSFFALAATEALKRFPIMNASVDDQTIIYHDYYDISIAVSSERGLVVPVIRHVETLHLADIERKISEFSEKAKNNKLTLEDMQGGTFTISNGGVFGSLMSTPILNPPQSAILGMHKIMQRPIVEEGVIVIRPMMYVALSYDHRIIDGADSVKFLVTIKDLIEDPARFVLEV